MEYWSAIAGFSAGWIITSGALKRDMDVFIIGCCLVSLYIMVSK